MTWILVAVASVALIVGLWLIVVVPKRQVERLPKFAEIPAEKRFKMENDARMTLVQILGGLAILAGLIYTGRQFQLAQTQELGDRYFHALEHLADNSSLSGHGSVLLLETVANESKRYSWQIMDLVAKYAELHAPKDDAEDNYPSCRALGSPPSDIQAVVATIGLRDTAYDRPNWFPDLSDVNLQGAWFQRYKFDGVGLERDRLECADFTDGHLKKANLTDSDARYAKFIGADLREAILEGTQLQHAHLENARLDGARLAGAQMEGAFLQGASLKGTDLSKVKGLTRLQYSSALPDKATTPPTFE